MSIKRTRELSISPRETLGKDCIKEWGFKVVNLEKAHIRAEDQYRKDPTEENRQRVTDARKNVNEAMDLKIALDNIGGDA